MFLPLLVLNVISTLCVMTSAEPNLWLNVTRDVTLTCDMAGFNREMAQLLSLQIVKKDPADPDKDAVPLATADYERAWAASSLSDTHPFHNVTGQLYSRSILDSSLKLTIYNFEPSDDGLYACQIHYLAHPADTQYSLWEATVTVNTSPAAEPSAHHEGFSVSVRRGVLAVCHYEGLIWYYALEEYGTVLGSWYGYRKSPTPGYTLPAGSVQPRVPERRWDVTESHKPGIYCDDFCQCHCPGQSLSQPWPYYDCYQQNPSISSTTPMEFFCGLSPPESPINVPINFILFVSIPVIIVVVLGFVIYRLWKTYCKSAPRVDNSDREAGEPLSGNPATKGETKDVDMRRSAEEQSVSGSDTVSMVSSVGGLGLDVRPQTASV